MIEETLDKFFMSVHALPPDSLRLIIKGSIERFRLRQIEFTCKENIGLFKQWEVVNREYTRGRVMLRKIHPFDVPEVTLWGDCLCEMRVVDTL